MNEIDQALWSSLECFRQACELYLESDLPAARDKYVEGLEHKVRAAQLMEAAGVTRATD